MKKTIGRKILTVIFVPFLIIFAALSVYISSTAISYFTDWTELEIKGISEINASQLEGKINSVRISVLSAADMLEQIDTTANNARGQAADAVRSVFANEYIYNAWVAYEPNAFDGKDSEYRLSYPGSPSGRFMLSYIMVDGRITVAPDMSEATLDNAELSPWYTTPRDERRLYIDVNNNSENLYDYRIGGEPVYTLSIVSPLFAGGRVIGCVGADVLFDAVTLGLDGSTSERNASVAIFYSNSRIFYADDIALAEESVDTLGFINGELIKDAMSSGRSLFLPDEYSPFLGENAFTYFQPMHSEGMGDSSLYLYVAVPRSAVRQSISPLFMLVAAISAAVLLALFAVFLYVTRRISRPIRELTQSADAISQGDIETSVAFFSASQGEIGVLSRSLHRMVEQFRVHTLMQECLQEETSLRGQFFLATQFPDTTVALSELSAMLGKHFDMHRVTIVLLMGGKASVVARCQTGRQLKPEPPADFLHHSQVTELLKPNRKLVFLNTFALATHELQFQGDDAVSLYILPLWQEQELRGYAILENNDRRKTPTANSERTMLYATSMIAQWLLDVSTNGSSGTNNSHGAQPACGARPAISADTHRQNAAQSGGFVSTARRIDGLCVDLALETMGGIEEIYEHSARLMTHTSPKTIAGMDEYLDMGKIKEFAIEIHGIKGALNNIGAIELGNVAARIETAAKGGDIDYCKEHYAGFKASFVTLLDDLSAAIPDEPGNAEKAPGNVGALLETLRATAAAAKGYDSLDAQEMLSPMSSFTYGARADEMLADILFALGSFDCERALEGISKLEVVLNDG